MNGEPIQETPEQRGERLFRDYLTSIGIDYRLSVIMSAMTYRKDEIVKALSDAYDLTVAQQNQP
jgi:hypothetical protein